MPGTKNRDAYPAVASMKGPLKSPGEPQGGPIDTSGGGNLKQEAQPWQAVEDRGTGGDSRLYLRPRQVAWGEAR